MRRALSELQTGQSGTVIEFQNQNSFHEGVFERLLEMGFIEGSKVKVIHRAPMGGDPIAVIIRGATIAVRASEARHIFVEVAG